MVLVKRTVSNTYSPILSCQSQRRYEKGDTVQYNQGLLKGRSETLLVSEKKNWSIRILIHIDKFGELCFGMMPTTTTTILNPSPSGQSC